MFRIFLARLCWEQLRPKQVYACLSNLFPLRQPSCQASLALNSSTPAVILDQTRQKNASHKVSCVILPYSALLEALRVETDEQTGEWVPASR